MDTVFVKLVFHKGFFVNHSFKIIFIKYIIRALKHQKLTNYLSALCCIVFI